MGPFLKSNNKTSKIMLNLLIALTPIVLFTTYKNGYIPYSKGYTALFGLLYPLIFILIGAITSFLTEVIYALIFKREIFKEYISESFGLFPGLFLSLVLPLNTPISVLITGAIFAIVIGKLVFGGFGKNIFNPALLGYLFIVVSFSSIFTTNAYLNPYELDTISGATPLTNSSLVSGIGTYKEIVAPYGNLWDFFIGNIPGSLGETSALFCLIGFIYLTLTKTIKWKIPVIYISTVFIANVIVARILGIGIYYPLFNVLSGGLMFGAIFMATDPVTSPVTNVGQILYGLFLGILTVLFRFKNVEGVSISILIMNMLVFILDRIGAKSRFNLSKASIWMSLTLVLILFVGVYIANNNKIDNRDPNFNIINKDVDASTTIYTVTEKGYGGNIKAEIKIKDDKVISFEILSNNESIDKYKLVTDSNYINKLVSSDDLENVDTVSGATITSTSLKKMLINVMEDYEKD